VRCPRCGNENTETNRFCGMCGATLLPASEPVAQGAATRSSAPPSSAPSASAQPRTSAPVSDAAPVISGPSFLGLNDPAPRKKASFSADSQASSRSSNLDYLLEDEEEHRRGGGGKFILFLLALALAVGFGYLRWKNQGFGWLGSHTNKPSAAAQSSEAPDTSSATPPASNSTSAPATPTPPPQPAPDPAANAGSPAAGPAPGSPTAAGPTPNPASGTAPPSASPAPADATPTSEAANPPADSAAAPPVPAAKEPAPAAPEAAPAALEAAPATNPKPNKAADQPPPKPHAAVKPVPAIDPVSEAQKYLYGRGVAQDCEHGLRILKPAANQSNPKAMIEMGALYSAGLCTPHDLPTAYRWFALALRKDPDNLAVQTDLQKLWGEMTQPERQLAIKLSQ
jgi:zinc-ribbon domain